MLAVVGCFLHLFSGTTGRTEHALVSAAALTLHLRELVDPVETLKVLLLLKPRYLKFAFTCLSRVLWVWSRVFLLLVGSLVFNTVPANIRTVPLLYLRSDALSASSLDQK